MNTNRIFTLSILSVLFLISFASAALNVTPSSISASGSSNSPVSFQTLTLNNTDPILNLTSITFTFPNLTSGSNTILSSNFVSVSSFDLQNGSSTTQAITLNIPAGQVAGTYTGKLVITATNSSNTITQNVSLSLTVTAAPSITISQSGLSKDSNGVITITNNGNSPLNNVVLSSLGDADFGVSFSPSSFTSIQPGSSVTASISSSNAANLQLGDDNTLTIKVTSDKANATTTVTIANDNLCSDGNVGGLKVSDFSITNDGQGSDTEWQPLDKIKMEATIENNGHDSISGIYAQIKILNSNDEDVTSDFKFDKTKISVGKINDGNDKTVTFTISELPVNVKEADDYKIYVKVYKSSDESNECRSSEEDTISVTKKYDRAAIVSSSDLNQTELSCGTNNEISFNVWNAGSNTEDHILVKLENTELKIKQYQLISNLNDGEKQRVTFDVPLPASLNKTRYNFQISTYFDYDSGDVYDESSYNQNSQDDLDSGDFILPVTVTNCQAAQQSSSALISANLASEAKVGENMIVQLTIRNTGAATTFVVTPNSYDSWAQLVSVDPQVISVNQGDSKQVTITLKPTKAGTQTFNLDAKTALGQSFSQQVQVTVAGGSTGLSALSKSFGSTGIFLIIAIALVAVLIIIVAVARVSRRKETL